MTILDYYRLIDPRYGHEAHQRAFVHRMDRVQSMNPCTKDHVALGDKPPIHTTHCYPLDRCGRMVGS